LAQPQPQHAKNARVGGPKPTRRRHNQQSQAKDPHHKAELFDTLRQLNRGYGIALASLNRLDNTKGKPGIFPREFLRNFRNRTEELRALANRDLLRCFAGREDQDAKRFGKRQ
jgi:hypothetical protein